MGHVHVTAVTVERSSRRVGKTINTLQSVQISELDIPVLRNARYKAAYEQEYRGWEGIDSTVNTKAERHVD